MIVTTADFTGFYILNQNTANTPRLLAMITRYEEYYIRKLLGVELGNLFIADYNAPPQDARFVAIYDPFQLSLDSCDHESRGMKDFLVAAIFYEYIINSQRRSTDNGVASSKDEAETIVSPQEARRFAERKWNEALDTTDAIYWYIKTYAPRTFANDPTMLYPEFNGKKFEPIFSPLI